MSLTRRSLNRANLLASARIIIAALLVCLSCANGQRPVEDDSVLNYLERFIAWHRDIAGIEASAARPKEFLFAGNLRESATQALRSAFQFARADAAFPAVKAQPGVAAEANGRGRNLVQAQMNANQRIEQVQNRLAEIDREMSAAPARLRPSLQAKREKLEGDLNLAKARRSALGNLIGLLSGTDAGLAGKIEDLEHTVPELNSAPKPADGATALTGASPSQEFHADSAGIVALATELFLISQKSSRLERILHATDELRSAHDGLRAPLRSALQEVIRQGDRIAQVPEDAAPSELAAARKESDDLLAKFKLVSAALAPSGQVTSALDASRGCILQLRSVLEGEHGAAMRYLMFRLAMLALVLLAILFFSEVARRGTTHYVQDMRRRRQLLLLRRVVVGCTIALFVALSFVSDFGSMATFAGFSAAGIALAMQSVILSVVAYFFLVGRWGVRVGDRVTVGGVTGDVIDIGLFRLYLMEVAGTGLDVRATGRVVVFPNAVFFQPSALFKQFPGTDYTWCTVTVALDPGSDHALAETRLLAATENVYSEYREAIERQHRAAQSSMGVYLAAPHPEASLRFNDSRMELVVRCPVEIRRMSEIADRLTREVAAAIEGEPRLRLAAGTTPRIQIAARGGVA